MFKGPIVSGLGLQGRIVYGWIMWGRIVQGRMIPVQLVQNVFHFKYAVKLSYFYILPQASEIISIIFFLHILYSPRAEESTPANWMTPAIAWLSNVSPSFRPRKVLASSMLASAPLFLLP